MNSTVSNYYKDAEEGRVFTKACLEKLEAEHGFEPDKTILATSVCSDEIIRSATNFRDYMSQKDPFQLGGLAGFPFTGMTGFKAFASHIPDDGYAVILYGPHIGVSNSGALGYVLRAGQHLESSCCGALIGAVSKQRSGDESELDKEFDYQQWKISDCLNNNKDEIQNDPEPLIKATESMFQHIEKRIKALLNKTAANFENTTVALVGGIIINTDFNHPDYFELRDLSVQKF